jgi:UDP-N-acetylglucosamine 2-epimerase (non-hydrolysing)
MKKIIIVAGARPNFMKIAPVLRELRSKYADRAVPILVHTGQHYDDNMSGSFFDSLGIPAPDHNLEVGSGTHADQTAKIMTTFEDVCETELPDTVVVVGDVNSTVAAGLVAKKLHIELAHIEAGLRSGDRTMPEEINRLATDAITDHFFVTEPHGLENLRREGHPEESIHYVGHVMIDNLLFQKDRLARLGPSSRAAELAQALPERYACLTLHRPSNVDSPEVLGRLVDTLVDIVRDLPIVFPCHPRTRGKLESFGLLDRLNAAITITEPLGYDDFLYLWQSSTMVLTDSGGLQEETTALGIPCITMRENTERPVTVDVGTNTLVGSDPVAIRAAVDAVLSGSSRAGRVPDLWDGKASERICRILVEGAQ